jgi:hypothetical protein
VCFWWVYCCLSTAVYLYTTFLLVQGTTTCSTASGMGQPGSCHRSTKETPGTSVRAQALSSQGALGHQDSFNSAKGTANTAAMRTGGRQAEPAAHYERKKRRLMCMRSSLVRRAMLLSFRRTTRYGSGACRQRTLRSSTGVYYIQHTTHTSQRRAQLLRSAAHYHDAVPHAFS